MNYKIISSSSRGNCTVINDTIALDMGISIKQIKPFENSLKIVLLTHIHKDHFNKSTIKHLKTIRPTLLFVCGKHLVNDLLNLDIDYKNIIIIKNNCLIDLKMLKIASFPLVHDVTQIGYRLVIDGEKIIYATDTNTLEHIKAKNYDLYLVEANYDEQEILERIRQKEEKGEFVYEYRTLKTHLSKQKCDEWLLKNMGQNSKYVYMHKHIEETKDE